MLGILSVMISIGALLFRAFGPLFRPDDWTETLTLIIVIHLALNLASAVAETGRREPGRGVPRVNGSPGVSTGEIRAFEQVDRKNGLVRLFN